jgi:hypothetical protein
MLLAIVATMPTGSERLFANAAPGPEPGADTHRSRLIEEADRGHQQCCQPHDQICREEDVAAGPCAS